MWAMGAIIAELLTLRPLFPGLRYIVLFIIFLSGPVLSDFHFPAVTHIIYVT